jgi:dimethylsulfoniopropionate demethylase
LCHLGDEISYIGRVALRQIVADGPVLSIRGIRFGGDKAPPCGKPFPVTDLHGVPVGQITSGIYSPRLNCNIGMSMILKTHWNYDTALLVHTPDGLVRDAVVSKLPF